MTMIEFVAVIWVFCSIVGGTAIFIDIRNWDNVQGIKDHALLVMFCLVVGLVLGPFSIGLVLGKILKHSGNVSAE